MSNLVVTESRDSTWRKREMIKRIVSDFANANLLQQQHQPRDALQDAFIIE